MKLKGVRVYGKIDPNRKDTVMLFTSYDKIRAFIRRSTKWLKKLEGYDYPKHEYAIDYEVLNHFRKLIGLSKVHGAYEDYGYEQKTFIEKKDWDVLIILDACRYDIFSIQLHNTMLNGKLCQVNSNSANTEEWYRNYWGENHKDIILISAHPRAFATECHYNFFQSYGLWDKRNWIEPEVALKKLIQIQDQYDKKFLVHLIPPHLPYIGEKGKEFLKELGVEGSGINVYKKVEEYGKENGWRRPYECYVENVQTVLEIIEEYIPKIKGKIVISADHGELIGDYGIYNHNYRCFEIFHVPWFKVKKND